MRATRVREQGEGLVLIIVILAVLGGVCWYLFSNRRNVEKEAQIYAREVAEHIALQRDARFIDLNLSPQAQVELPPSARQRLVAQIGELGAADRQIKITGRVTFNSYFFEPKGSFRAQINFSAAPAFLDMVVSASHGPWQIDELNLTRTPNPTF
jgi:hypothetical protein